MAGAERSPHLGSCKGAFGGLVFSSADSGSGGFPPGNDDPAEVSWHRAGVFSEAAFGLASTASDHSAMG